MYDFPLVILWRRLQCWWDGNHLWHRVSHNARQCLHCGKYERTTNETL